MRLEEHKGLDSGTKKAPVIPLEVEGRAISTDDEGYLVSFEDWSRAVAEALAARDGVPLTDEHWILIDFLHRFYNGMHIAPEMPILSRQLCKDQSDCRWTSGYIKTLFPGGAKMACRYAGLPGPVGRSCL